MNKKEMVLKTRRFKFFVLLVMVLALSFVTMGCGVEVDDTSQDDKVGLQTNDNDNDNDDSNSVDQTEEVKSEIGKRSNPVPFGQTATFSNNYYGEDDEIEAVMSVTFSNLVRGEEAYNYLIEANQFNDAAPEGFEWVIIDVKLTLDQGSEDDAYYVMPSFIPIDSSGSQVNQQDLFATFADGEGFGYVDLYEGGEATGKIGILLPVGDDNVLIEFSDWSASVFFSLK